MRLIAGVAAACLCWLSGGTLSSSSSRQLAEDADEVLSQSTSAFVEAAAAAEHSRASHANAAEEDEDEDEANDEEASADDSAVSEGKADDLEESQEEEDESAEDGSDEEEEEESEGEEDSEDDDDTNDDAALSQDVDEAGLEEEAEEEEEEMDVDAEDEASEDSERDEENEDAEDVQPVGGFPMMSPFNMQSLQALMMPCNNMTQSASAGLTSSTTSSPCASEEDQEALAKVALKTVFSKIDANSDGKISSPELGKFGKELEALLNDTSSFPKMPEGSKAEALKRDPVNDVKARTRDVQMYRQMVNVLKYAKERAQQSAEVELTQEEQLAHKEAYFRMRGLFLEQKRKANKELRNAKKLNKAKACLESKAKKAAEEEKKVKRAAQVRVHMSEAVAACNGGLSENEENLIVHDALRESPDTQNDDNWSGVLSQQAQHQKNDDTPCSADEEDPQDQDETDDDVDDDRDEDEESEDQDEDEDDAISNGHRMRSYADIAAEGSVYSDYDEDADGDDDDSLDLEGAEVEDDEEIVDENGRDDGDFDLDDEK